MANNYYQKHKENLRKERYQKDIKIFLKKKKTKGKKGPRHISKSL